jgi:hypothetical protein
MANNRPQFLPQISSAQRLLQVLALGDVVRDEATGYWYIGDGVTPGGVLGGPPTQAALAAILTGVDQFNPDVSAPITLLFQEVSDNRDAIRALVNHLYTILGDDLIADSDMLASMLIT